MEDIHIEAGLRPEHRALAARGYWQAFSGKLEWPLGPEETAVAFIEANLDPTHAISAVSVTGEFLGVAGFKTPKGAFAGGDFSALVETYGTLDAAWRSVLLCILERECKPGMLLMDGIFVQPEARGRGVGSLLLAAIESHAAACKLQWIRLDVIDTNPRARALYERQGFKRKSDESMGFLSHVFGFNSVTMLMKRVGT